MRGGPLQDLRLHLVPRVEARGVVAAERRRWWSAPRSGCRTCRGAPAPRARRGRARAGRGWPGAGAPSRPGRTARRSGRARPRDRRWKPPLAMIGSPTSRRKRRRVLGVGPGRVAPARAEDARRTGGRQHVEERRARARPCALRWRVELANMRTSSTGERARVLLRVDEAEAVRDVQVVDAQLLEPAPVRERLVAGRCRTTSARSGRPSGQAHVQRQVVEVPAEIRTPKRKSRPTSRRMATTISSRSRNRLSGRAAVAVAAAVDGRVQELVDQVALRRRDLEAVAAGLPHAHGRRGEVRPRSPRSRRPSWRAAGSR